MRSTSVFAKSVQGRLRLDTDSAFETCHGRPAFCGVAAKMSFVRDRFKTPSECSLHRAVVRDSDMLFADLSRFFAVDSARTCNFGRPL